VARKDAQAEHIVIYTNTMNSKLELAKGLLKEGGLEFDDGLDARLHEYVDLIREWNGFAGLLSRRDLGEVWDRHVIDSLSLAPLISRAASGGRVLDIGSGAGFPAVPVKLVLSGIPFTLMERSQRKMGFLRKAAGMLGIERVDMVLGQFPEDARGVEASVITGRAVERPEHMLRSILNFMPRGCTFVCQARIGNIPPMFHVEHVDDEWGRSGLRRGKLVLIRKR